MNAQLRIFTTRILLTTVAAAAAVYAPACRPNAQSAAQSPQAMPPQKDRLPGEIVPESRMRDSFPIRLGIVALRGLGDASAEQEPSADAGVTLGPNGLAWIATHCDVAAFDSRCVKPDTFPAIRKQQKLFTGLLFTYASSLYDQPDHRGSVGVWKPEMAAWELKTKSGLPVQHPDPGGHWMDCRNAQWQSYWASQAFQLAARFHADGVIAADMPVGNTFIGADVPNYQTFAEKTDATSVFLTAVHNPAKFLVVPSAVGFDGLVGRATLPVEAKRIEPRLSGRCWDEFDKLDDGAWAEGWVQYPWQPAKLTESDWEIEIEAADRAGRMGDVFIAGLGYSTPDELEYGLASFLLVVHHQGRMVVQPMPNAAGQNDKAGMSLRVMMNEYIKYKNYFDAELGAAPKERKYVPVTNGMAWRRSFRNGDVYVNPSDTKVVSVQLAGPMRTVRNETVRTVYLGPKSGIILLNLMPDVPLAP